MRTWNQVRPIKTNRTRLFKSTITILVSGLLWFLWGGWMVAAATAGQTRNKALLQAKYHFKGQRKEMGGRNSFRARPPQSLPGAAAGTAKPEPVPGEKSLRPGSGQAAGATSRATAPKLSRSSAQNRKARPWEAARRGWGGEREKWQQHWPLTVATMATAGATCGGRRLRKGRLGGGRQRCCLAAGGQGPPARPSPQRPWLDAAAAGPIGSGRSARSVWLLRSVMGMEGWT